MTRALSFPDLVRRLDWLAHEGLGWHNVEYEDWATVGTMVRRKPDRTGRSREYEFTKVAEGPLAKAVRRYGSVMIALLMAVDSFVEECEEQGLC